MNTTTLQALRELSRDGGVPLRIRGACMTPVMANGADVSVRARRFYLPGDVLVFRTRAGDLAAHRMLGWRGASFVTKGDHCEVHDPPVRRVSVIGAVVVPVRLRDRMRAMAELGRIVVRRLAR